MKQRIAKVLVNIISLIDIALIRMRNREAQINDNSIALIRLDAIGDFIMWLDAAKNFRENTDGRIVVICNKVCYDIAQKTGYFDEIIELDFAKLRRTSKVIYRWSVHKTLKNVNVNKAIQCTYSKEIFSDMVMSAVTATKKITIDSPSKTSDEWKYRLAKPIYQEIIETPKENVMEVHRNTLLVGKIFKKQIDSELPFIKEDNNDKKKVPKGKYYILFPGASETERMWPTERFAQLAMQIAERNVQLKCCLCGGSGEAYLADLFMQHYNAKVQVINIMGKTSLPELAEVIRGAEFIVTNDTSAVHFAAAVNTQAFCIWGPWEYGRFLPYDVNKKENRKMPIVCYHDMECKDCLLYGIDKADDCKKYISQNNIRKCLDLVTVDEVMEKIEKWEITYRK